MYRSRNCGELRRQDVGTEVVLAGWVHRRRDHGGLIFIDLRDRSGLVQIVLNSAAEKIRIEYVISVKGKIVERAAELTHNMYQLEYILPHSRRNRKTSLKMDSEQEVLYKATR